MKSRTMTDYAPENGLRVLSSEEKGGEEGGVPLAGSICTECGKVFFVPLQRDQGRKRALHLPPLP